MSTPPSPEPAAERPRLHLLHCPRLSGAPLRPRPAQRHRPRLRQPKAIYTPVRAPRAPSTASPRKAPSPFTRKAWASPPASPSTADGNLYVGDRSGTIFKVHPDKIPSDGSPADREIFVYATLEPSISAYHLAFNDEGTLFVSGPTTSSNQAIHAIDRDGRTTVFYQGLGRAQGLAFDVAGNLYVAASLRGQRGIVRITPQREASLIVSGNDLVGLAFLEDGCAALATKDALYHVALDIEGRKLV